MNVEILLILDRSGSMAPLAADVIHAFNGFIDRQMAQGRSEAMVSLTLFGTTVKHSFSALPLMAVPRLTVQSYDIEGMTALYDALGGTLQKAHARVQEENWADHVLVAIITDGEENASHRWSREGAAAKVQECLADGWHFVFLGAGLKPGDVGDMARAIGIDPACAFDVRASGAGIDEAFALIGNKVLLLEGPA